MQGKKVLHLWKNLKNIYISQPVSCLNAIPNKKLGLFFIIYETCKYIYQLKMGQRTVKFDF